MAKGTVTAELAGLDGIITALQALPEQIVEAKKVASKAMMEQGERDLQRSYLSVGGTAGDYVYNSIGSYGRPLPSDPDNYWTSVGVFTIAGVREAQASKLGKEPSKVLTAAQVAYWIENGTSRLRSGARKPRNFVAAAFNPEDLIEVQPRPFITEAFFIGWDAQRDAFAEAFNNKIQELKR